jgi:hypothetical protein
LKGNDGKNLPTAKLFGAGALLFTIFGAFIAYQTFTLRFTSTESSFSLVKADGSSSGENVVVGRLKILAHVVPFFLIFTLPLCHTANIQPMMLPAKEILTTMRWCSFTPAYFYYFLRTFYYFLRT